MSLSEEQKMDLMSRPVRIIDPPSDQPQLRNQTGMVAMLVDGAEETKCVLMLEDGSGVTLSLDHLQLL